jgi:thymidylate synthase
MLDKAIKNLRSELYNFGEKVTTANWQGMENPPEFLEILNASFEAQMPETLEEITMQCRPFLPWAEEHFAERVSGLPLNPPPSHARWLKDTDKSLKDGKFSHTYPERMHQNLFRVVELLKKDPYTRQAYLPIWDLEKDNSLSLNNERVPCTLGWHWILRNGQLHCYYPMRSCDALRHFHNDIYFASRLTLWLIEQTGIDAKPGLLTFHAVSFHCFTNDHYTLGRFVK